MEWQFEMNEVMLKRKQRSLYANRHFWFVVGHPAFGLFPFGWGAERGKDFPNWAKEYLEISREKGIKVDGDTLYLESGSRIIKSEERSNPYSNRLTRRNGMGIAGFGKKCLSITDSSLRKECVCSSYKVKVGHPLGRVVITFDGESFICSY